MSFAMSVLNAAVNNANNVNNNNNNNNNNDNNNNNNVANINIANANNNANNMNMATAGRRRRKIVRGEMEPGEIISEEFENGFEQNFEQISNKSFEQNYPSLNISSNKTLQLSGDKYAIKAIRIGYINENETEADQSNKMDDTNLNKTLRFRSGESPSEENSNIIEKLSEFLDTNQFSLKTLEEKSLSIFGQISNLFSKYEVDLFPLKAKEFVSKEVSNFLNQNLKESNSVVETMQQLFQLGGRVRRNTNNISTLAEDASLATLIYIDMFLHVVGGNQKPG